MMTSEWLTPAEAGALLGVGPDRVAQLARAGALVSMRTPGGHLRIRRDSVEDVANPPADPPPEPDDLPPAERDAAPEPEPSPPPRPKWEQVAPWKRRVREAEADVEVLRLEDEKERLLEAQTERQALRERTGVERAAALAEASRLKQLKARALSFMPWGVPADVEAEVARQLERGVTAERYAAGLSQTHIDKLLRADIERYLRPWRTREARRERVRQDASKRDTVIQSAVLTARLRAPRAWDYQTKEALEREIRALLKDEWHPGMEQDEADDIALDVLDQWVEEDGEDS